MSRLTPSLPVGLNAQPIVRDDAVPAVVESLLSEIALTPPPRPRSASRVLRPASRQFKFTGKRLYQSAHTV